MTDRDTQIREALDSFDIDGARALIREALRDNPTADTYYLASLVALNEDQRQGFLRQALALDPFHADAYAAQSSPARPVPAPAQPAEVTAPAPARAPSAQRQAEPSEAVQPRSAQPAPDPAQPEAQPNAAPQPERRRGILGGLSRGKKLGIGAALLAIIALVALYQSQPRLTADEGRAFDSFVKANGGGSYRLTYREHPPILERMLVGTCVVIDPPLKGQTAFVLRGDISTSDGWVVFSPDNPTSQWNHVGCNGAVLEKAKINRTAVWQMPDGTTLSARPTAMPTAVPTATAIPPTVTPARPQANIVTSCATLDEKGKVVGLKVEDYNREDRIAFPTAKEFTRILVSLGSVAYEYEYQLESPGGDVLREGTDYIVIREKHDGGTIDSLFVNTQQYRQVTMYLDGFDGAIPLSVGGICMDRAQMGAIALLSLGNDAELYKPLVDWYTGKNS